MAHDSIEILLGHSETVIEVVDFPIDQYFLVLGPGSLMLATNMF